MSGPDTEVYTRISTPDQFANLAVFEREGEGRHIYSIEFDNADYEGGGRTMAGIIALPAALVFGFVGFGVSVAAGDDFGATGFFIAAGVTVAGVVALIAPFMRPWNSRYAIEIDPGPMELRVWRKGRLKITRKLSPDMAFTVDAHPDAEHARMVRQEERKTALSRPEKQHCLFGWFGAKGGEQVVLVTRAEWPCRNSLYEVRQAIIWTLDQAAQRVAGDAAAAPGTIRPPLD